MAILLVLVVCIVFICTVGRNLKFIFFFISLSLSYFISLDKPHAFFQFVSDSTYSTIYYVWVFKTTAFTDMQ